MNINIYVGNKIREYRKKKKLTQAELGKMLGVAQNTIAGYENGTYEVGYDNLFRLAEIFGIKVDDLFPETKHNSDDILERAGDLSDLGDLGTKDLNFIKKLAEKTLSLNEEEKEKFFESIKFTVEYYDKMKDD